MQLTAVRTSKDKSTLLRKLKAATIGQQFLTNDEWSCRSCFKPTENQQNLKDFCSFMEKKKTKLRTNSLFCVQR